jgi:hypothetical protein
MINLRGRDRVVCPLRALLFSMKSNRALLLVVGGLIALLAGCNTGGATPETLPSGSASPNYEAPTISGSGTSPDSNSTPSTPSAPTTAPTTASTPTTTAPARGYNPYYNPNLNRPGYNRPDYNNPNYNRDYNRDYNPNYNPDYNNPGNSGH